MHFSDLSTVFSQRGLFFYNPGIRKVEDEEDEKEKKNGTIRKIDRWVLLSV